MNGELFGLAVQGIGRKKRSSLLLFAVLLLSFAFAIISLTVTGSIRKTNEEYRYDTYGTWYGAIPNGRESDEAFLREQAWLDELGITKSYGTIQASSSGSTGIGVMDEAFLRVGRISLQDGRFPENAGEIAMEADLLSALGYDYTLGQEITLTITLPATAQVKADDSEELKGQGVSVPVEQTFTLCGVIREYADLWMRGSSYIGLPPLNSAMITPEAAEALRQSALEAANALRDDMTKAMDGEGEVTNITLSELKPQYYFSVRPGSESEMREQSNEYMKSEGGDRAVAVNTAAFLGEEEESIEGFYAGLILAVTLLAVVCIYAIRMQDEARQLAIFRSIGITKRQLCMMLLYETLSLGVPAMILGTGAGALGTWALLRLAVYSGSAPVQVVVPPALLAAAAGLWLVGVLAARLAVFLVALRSPLTGRFHIARKKARRYRDLQRILIAGLSALLCAAVVFTVLESLDPIRGIRYMSSLADYTVYRKSYGYYPNTLFWFSGDDNSINDYTHKDFTVPKEAAAPFSQVPGVAHAWGWGQEYVRLDFDGLEDAPLASEVRAILDQWALHPGKDIPFGIGPYDPDAFSVTLAVVDEGDWEDIIDFDAIDREKFRSGDAVFMSFTLGSDGGFIAAHNIRSSLKEFEETGLTVGDTIRITIGTPEVYATVETQVGGIITYTSDASRGGLSAFPSSYTIICSEAFLEKLLDALGPGEAWNEFRQGTPYGYEQISVFVDQNAEYLSTDAVLAELCSREDLMLDAEMRALKRTSLQEDTQTLILLISGGGCAALVLLLILGNTLSMEAERQKQSCGILQALGMSRRQLRRRQLGTALVRSILAAALGWLAYGGYCVIYALREQNRRLEELGTTAYMDNIRDTITVQRIIEQKITEIVRYWGDWQVILPLTALCIGSILVVSWLAKRRLTREDLMVKLRDEH